MRRKLVSERKRHSVHCRLREVVEERDTIARRVVLGRTVGYLDDQSARRFDQQRQREMTGDRVRIDAET